ncbi:MAG: flippase-like domain-containing protein [Candidatus Zixiibacteriota bacterium]|nr:MAG: flippase-like domain-containing protein [candidate division Zixibacteria bacterium]
MTIGLLIYCFYDLDLYAVLNAISAIDIRYLIPLIFIEVIIAVIRASRFTYFVDAFKPAKIRKIFPIYCIGIMTNLLMPYLTGQVARIFLLSKKAHVKKTSIFTTTVLEVLFDGLAIISIFLVISLFEVIPDDFQAWHFIAMGGAVVLVTAVLFVISRSHTKSHNFVHRFTKRLSPGLRTKIDEIKFSFLSGLEALKSSKHLSVVSILSVLWWIFQAAMVYLLILAFGFKISIWGAVIITAIVNIMMTVVVSPWNIGTFQGATVAAMAPFGIGKSEALAFSFLLHIFVYLPPIILGALSSFKEGLTFRQIKDESEKEAEEIEKEKKTLERAEIVEVE